METSEAIKSRRSVRAFLPEPVPMETVADLLETARWCGSFVNSQPWKCTVLGGAAMGAWKAALWDNFESGVTEEREYTMGPMPMPEPHMARAEAFRNSIDSLMFPPEAENREEKRQAYTKSGIVVRDAPCAVLVHMDREMAASPLHLLAAGGFVQAVALAALDRGLGSCVMGRPVESPRLLRRLAGIPESDLILCCVALGYADPEGLINSLPRTRAALSEFVSWRGFSGE